MALLVSKVSGIGFSLVVALHRSSFQVRTFLAHIVQEYEQGLEWGQAWGQGQVLPGSGAI